MTLGQTAVFVLKIIGVLSLLAIIAVATGAFFLQRRFSHCRLASDTMLEEYSPGKPAKNIFVRAQQLGFTYFAVQNLTSQHELNLDFTTVSSQVSLTDLQQELDASASARVRIHIVPFPPFLRWILNFEIQSGQVKSVERSQLD